MYLVLKNNMIPYCGMQDLIQNDYVYYQNNVKYIRKLLTSIVMKEYSSLEIIRPKKIEVMEKVMGAITKIMEAEVKNGINHDREKVMEEAIGIIREEGIDVERVMSLTEIKEFKENTEALIRFLFQTASLNANRVHFQTLKANLRNVGERKLMGYWRTYRHQWNQLFHEAYADVVSRMGGELAECYGTAQGAFEAALSNMEQRFLGESEQLKKKNLEETIEKTEFRQYLEEMFDGESLGQAIYSINPFKEEFDVDKMTPWDCRVLFQDIFDFAKGLNNPIMLQKFADKFIRDLKVQIEVDNAAKAENIIKLNRDFAEELAGLENMFAEKYDIKGDKNKVNFYSMMQYYFRRRQ